MEEATGVATGEAAAAAVNEPCGCILWDSGRISFSKGNSEAEEL